MKAVRYIVVTFALLVALSSHAHALEVSPSPPTPKTTSPLLVTEFRTSNQQIHYIQLYNNGSEAVYLPHWQLVNRYGDSSGEYRYDLPNGYLPPGRYLVLSADAAIAGEQIEPLSAIEEFESTDSFWLVSTNGVFADEPVPIATSEPGKRYHRYTSTAGNYTATRTFSPLRDQAAMLVADVLYHPREDFPLAPIEILANARNCAPGENDATCSDYVKFYNHTSEAIDFAGVRLRIGYQGQSSTANNTVVLGGELLPGEFAVFAANGSGAPLNLTNSGAFVWLEDEHGVVTYHNTTVEYPDASNRKGRSWAIDPNGEWYWATPNPGGENSAPIVESAGQGGAAPRELTPCRDDQFRNPLTNRCNKIAAESEPKPCEPDQERNPETGRCRKIPVAAGLKPCTPDQERNPETGRCRKIGGTASSLTPCKPGQERNPDTNRCRSVTLARAELKPCAPGQERNPATNRCRKIKVDNTSPEFAVEAMEASRDTIASWWALGGVGSLALGYAGWEWRVEMMRWLRRVREFFAAKG